MTDENSTGPATGQPAPRWRPVAAIDRRVLGVLAEKAKTTPDTYPMSLNAIVTGCNQKSNRAPLMQLEPDNVQESLDRLRELGAIGMVEGYGRVTKYRHYLYEWLGVEKVELSVMAELLLRGPQTEGELRGRVSRMDPVPDLTALRALLTSLGTKGLVLSLTPEGRGHVLAHAMYPPREMEHLKTQYGQRSAAEFHDTVAALPPEAGRSPAPRAPMPPAGRPVLSVEAPGNESLRREVEGLRLQVAQLRGEMENLAAVQQQTAEDLGRLKDALGG